MQRSVSRPLVSAAAVVAVLLIAGCSPEAIQVPSQTASPTATATASPTPSVPVLEPDGSAQDNLAVFTWVMESVWESKSRGKGRAYIDALHEVGFDRDAMEVTRDTSTVGNQAESLQFSVLWDGECLVGQVGPSIKEPTARVLPELPEGGCLVGETRPIDW